MLLQFTKPRFGPHLNSDSRSRCREAGSVLVMFTLMVPFLLVPLVGLAIDATMLYTVKARLQTAVDGGALAAAQSLKSGLTFAVQRATAEKTADQFIRANFVVAGAIAGNKGFWRSYNLKDGATDCNGGPCIVAAQDDINKRRTVSVTASVSVPLMFMRILGITDGTVAATGTAARRDVVMMLVLDRSSSMTDALAALKAGATYFVSQFQAGRDRVGLVVFGGSAMVAYPPTDWGKDPPPNSAFTGPDTHFVDTPDSAEAPNVLTSISNLKIESNTGTADALMLAYKELQAANQPGALNIIVLWTDGKPNGITANFNQNGVSAVKAASKCLYKSDGGDATKSMIGWMSQWGGYVSGTNPIPANAPTFGHGLYTRSQTNKTFNTNVTDWVKETQDEPVIPGLPSTGCDYVGNQAKIQNDIAFPATDIYGNSTQGSSDPPYTLTDYKVSSSIWANECNDTAHGPQVNFSLATSSVADACQVGLASWNLADMAGKLIHSDTTLLPVIYCMGYKGNGGDDPGLMRRLANVNVNNSVFNSNPGIPVGMYLPIATVDDIVPAFQSVLAEILRLAM